MFNDDKNEKPAEIYMMMSNLLTKLRKHTVEEVAFKALVAQVRETQKNDTRAKEKERKRKMREEIEGMRRRNEIMNKYLDPICPFCSKRLNNLNGLSTHLRIIHGYPNNKGLEE